MEPMKPKLLKKVEQGERITITKHGVPIAVLQPIEPDRHIDIRSAILEILKFREKNKLSGLSIREMIEEGRR